MRVADGDRQVALAGHPWYSGARYDGSQYVWSAAVERPRRSDVFAPLGKASTSLPFPPVPAPLVGWP